MPPLDLHVPIYDRPIYTRGSGPPMMPISLTPPDDNSGWVINSKINLNGVPQYIVSHPDEPQYRPAVRLEKILDWVSQRVYEDFEFELAKARDRAQWELEEEILRKAEVISRKRQKIANTASVARRASNSGQQPKQAPTATLEADSHQASNVAQETAAVSEAVFGDRSIKGQPSPNKVKRKRTPGTIDVDSTPGRQAIPLERPGSSSQPSLSEEARRLHPSLSRDFVPGPILDDPAQDSLDGEQGLNIVSHKKTPSRRKLSGSMPPPRRSSRSTSTSNVSLSDRRSTRNSRSRSERTESPTPSKTRRRDSDNLVIPADWSKIPGAKSRSTPVNGNENGHDHSESKREASTVSASSSTQSTKKRMTTTTQKKASKDSIKKAGDETWAVKSILDHEYRDGKIKGERNLYYLIEWECDYSGQWDPSWEPASNVGEGSRAEYHDQLASNDAGDLGISNKSVASIYTMNSRNHEDSPEAQVEDDLMADLRLEVQSPPGSKG